VTNSAFENEVSGVFADFLGDATATVCHNTFTYTVPGFAGVTGFYDVSNSKLLFCGNQGSGVTSGSIGIVGWQSLYRSDSPSTVYVSDNDFQVSGGAEGIALFDYGTPSTLSAVVSGNVVQTDTSCGCYAPSSPVILTQSLKSAVVSLNRITNTPSGGAPGIYVSYGPAWVLGNVVTGAYNGVWVDYASGVHVTANVIKNSAQYGIAVTDGSSDIMVTGNFVHNTGVFDLYWDQTGTSNVWKGNLCSTSSPAGLC
jgi:hypothetical protein